MKDSEQATLTHIRRVQRLLADVAERLIQRAILHDESKLCEPEASVFEMYTAKLAGSTYGSPEYKQFLAEMKPALDHHYAFNRHHPEHTQPGLEFRDVVGFEGLYRVSNYGDVMATARIVPRNGGRGDLTTPERILSPFITPKGYLRIQLGRNGSSANRMVHRLVAEAFIPNPEKKPQVNHKNGEKSDNRARNLEWATASENQIHAYDSGLKESAVKYVVHCPELDITTFGIEKMEDQLRERGYERADAAGIWSAMDRGGKHLDLTFEGTLLSEWRRSQIRDMTLLDLIEMLVDWKAAGERHANGSIAKSLDANKPRFGYGDELDSILRRTALELWPVSREQWHCFACGASGMEGNFCEMCGAGRHDFDRKA